MIKLLHSYCTYWMVSFSILSLHNILTYFHIYLIWKDQQTKGTPLYVLGSHQVNQELFFVLSIPYLVFLKAILFRLYSQFLQYFYLHKRIICIINSLCIFWYEKHLFYISLRFFGWVCFHTFVYWYSCWIKISAAK